MIRDDGEDLCTTFEKAIHKVEAVSDSLRLRLHNNEVDDYMVMDGFYRILDEAVGDLEYLYQKLFTDKESERSESIAEMKRQWGAINDAADRFWSYCVGNSKLEEIAEKAKGQFLEEAMKITGIKAPETEATES